MTEAKRAGLKRALIAVVFALIVVFAIWYCLPRPWDFIGNDFVTIKNISIDKHAIEIQFTIKNNDIICKSVHIEQSENQLILELHSNPNSGEKSVDYNKQTNTYKIVIERTEIHDINQIDCIYLFDAWTKKPGLKIWDSKGSLSK